MTIKIYTLIINILNFYYIVYILHKLIIKLFIFFFLIICNYSILYLHVVYNLVLHHKFSVQMLPQEYFLNTFFDKIMLLF